MSYRAELLPFRFHRLSTERVLAVSESGDYVFLPQHELEGLVSAVDTLPLARVAELKSKFFLATKGSRGIVRLLASRIAARKETVLSGPSLHMIVPTLQCAHSCRYCQVSRRLEDTGFSMPLATLDAACDLIFKSPSKSLTVEFQGGDPLLRFDLVRHAIERIALLNQKEKRDIRFVVASTLHQLTEGMCAFFLEHGVLLSTSLDGPPALHNRNRPLPTRDAYERTVGGIALARRMLGHDSVSALMTTTQDSLACPEAIVDEYVGQGFGEIFIRPLSPYGFARRNERALGYSVEAFQEFYERAFGRVMYWNAKGVPIREVTASIALNKMLSPFDAGYVDLQSPTGAGLAALLYNYDGYVYPSDEARMLAETGDASLRLGRIGEPLSTLLSGTVARKLVKASLARHIPGCSDCAFNPYCGPDPVGAQSQFGTIEAPVAWTRHCLLQKWLFDFLFRRVEVADPVFMELAHRWACPPGHSEAS